MNSKYHLQIFHLLLLFLLMMLRLHWLSTIFPEELIRMQQLLTSSNGCSWDNAQLHGLLHPGVKIKLQKTNYSILG